MNIKNLNPFLASETQFDMDVEDSIANGFDMPDFSGGSLPEIQAGRLSNAAKSIGEAAGQGYDVLKQLWGSDTPEILKKSAEQKQLDKAEAEQVTPQQEADVEKAQQEAMVLRDKGIGGIPKATDKSIDYMGKINQRVIQDPEITEDLMDLQTLEDIFKAGAEKHKPVSRTHQEIFTEFRDDPNAFGQALYDSLSKTNVVLTDRQSIALQSYIMGKLQGALKMHSMTDKLDPAQQQELIATDNLIKSLLAVYDKKGTEAGRALASRNAAIQVLGDNNIQAATDYLKQNAGTTFDRLATAQQIIESGKYEPETMMDKLKAFYTASKEPQQIFVDYVKNGWLMNTATQVKNFKGNTVFTLYDVLLVNNLAAAIGQTRGKLTGDLNYYGAAEGAYRNLALLASMNKTVKGLLRGLKEGSSFQGDKLEYESSMDKVRQLIGDYAGENSRLKTLGSGAVTVVGEGAYKVMGGLDEMSKELIFNQEMLGLIVRKAQGEGVPHKDLPDYVNNMMANPEPDIIDAAIAKANKLTYSTNEEAGGMFGGFVNTARKAEKTMPLLGLVTAFAGTANTILNESASIALPLFSKRWRDGMKAGGAERDRAYAEAAMAFTITAGIVNIVESGLCSGAGYSNLSRKEAMEKTGWQEYSCKIGDEWHSYKSYEPVSTMLGIYATATERMAEVRDEETAKNIIGFMWGSIYEYLHSLPMLQGFQKITELTNLENKGQLQRWAADMTVSAVPFSSQLKTEARLEDTVKRRTKDDNLDPQGFNYYLEEGFKNLTADMKKTKRAALYWDGTPRADLTPSYLSRVGEKISPIPDQDDKLNMELIKNNAVPQLPKNTVSFGGITFSLLALDDGDGAVLQDMQEFVGKKLRDELTPFIEEEDYKKAGELNEFAKQETGGQQMLLRTRAGKIKAAAVQEYLSEKLKPMLLELQREDAALNDIATYIVQTDFETFIDSAVAGDTELTDRVENFNKKVRRSGKYNIDADTRIKPME